MILKAVILGIIEGLTEFLPVSSTGHLIIANTFIPLEKDFEALFNIVIQFGAILAVVFCYRKELLPEKLFSFLRPGFYRSELTDEAEREEGRKFLSLWGKIIIAFIPAAVIGVFIDDILEKYLFNTQSVSIALIAGAILMFAADKKADREALESVHSLSVRQAVAIGFFQCLAMWPGMSRSASTIAGGLFSGLSRSAAAEFSFFLGIPTIMGASLYKLLKSSYSVTAGQWAALAVGTAVSFIVALAVIRLFIGYLRKKGLLPFAVYRVVLGLVIILFFEV